MVIRNRHRDPDVPSVLHPRVLARAGKTRKFYDRFCFNYRSVKKRFVPETRAAS